MTSDQIRIDKKIELSTTAGKSNETSLYVLENKLGISVAPPLRRLARMVSPIGTSCQHQNNTSATYHGSFTDGIAS